ncbi:hypothetical protein LSTR_LSTR002004 [Laodelphax striatellus]|uniref:NAD-dependent protein deacetylase n=1 Tax=Laodelphax striatellus TaxID=195883 RepID=A0A482XGV6_LAOST|nr:hypothetical protein LSTR_LSTR002004 [Laodelphax striatellus]
MHGIIGFIKPHIQFGAIPVLFPLKKVKVKGALLQLLQRCSTTSNSFQNAANQLKNSSSRVLVLTGAGLSTASGIPDFRSPGSGLYDNLEKYNLPYPEAIFDLSYFHQNPKPFLTLAQELYPGSKYVPNIGHYFVRLLENKKKLLRVFTQNIDGLERLAGVSDELLVEAHGSFVTASCIKCKRQADGELVKQQILTNKIPECEICKNLVKPDIVFFGEQLPERYIELSMNDPFLADFLIVIGTSLQVYPFAGLANMVPSNVTRMLINRETVGSFGMRDNDVVLNGDITSNIELLAKELGWWDDLVALEKDLVS